MIIFTEFIYNLVQLTTFLLRLKHFPKLLVPTINHREMNGIHMVLKKICFSLKTEVMESYRDRTISWRLTAFLRRV